MIDTPKFFYQLKPNCLGELGPGTEANWKAPYLEQSSKIGYLIMHPPEDDLSQIASCVVVTERLKNLIEQAAIDKITFCDCAVTLERQFAEMYTEWLPLPPMFWLKFQGVAMQDDFGWDADFELVVSDRVIDLLDQVAYNYYDTIVLSGGEAAEAKIAHRRAAYPYAV